MKNVKSIFFNIKCTGAASTRSTRSKQDRNAGRTSYNTRVLNSLISYEQWWHVSQCVRTYFSSTGKNLKNEKISAADNVVSVWWELHIREFLFENNSGELATIKVIGVNSRTKWNSSSIKIIYIYIKLKSRGRTISRAGCHYDSHKNDWLLEHRHIAIFVSCFLS